MTKLQLLHIFVTLGIVFLILAILVHIKCSSNTAYVTVLKITVNLFCMMTSVDQLIICLFLNLIIHEFLYILDAGPFHIYCEYFLLFSVACLCKLLIFETIFALVFYLVNLCFLLVVEIFTCIFFGSFMVLAFTFSSVLCVKLIFLMESLFPL